MSAPWIETADCTDNVFCSSASLRVLDVAQCSMRGRPGSRFCPCICFVLGFGTNLKDPAAPAGLTSSCKYTMCFVALFVWFFFWRCTPKSKKKGSTSIIFSLFIGMQLMDEVIFFLCVFLCAPMGKLLHFKPGFHSLWWDTVGFTWIRHLFCWLFQHALRIMWENQLWEEEEFFNQAVPLFLSV